jgi:threonine/homoserine/homoserine lactone efflux protein
LAVLDWHSLILFASATLVLVLVPGPNTLYIVTRSLHHGCLAGMVSSLGVQAGTVLHLIAAGLGVSALLAASPDALTVVRYAGAAYLLGLGVKTLVSKGGATAMQPEADAPLSWVFSQGVLVNLLNPKTITFLVAFLPHFVDPARGSVALQTLALGSVMCALGLTSDLTYAAAAGRLAGVLRASPAFARRRRYLAGGVYIGLGAAMALVGPGRR